MNTLKINVCLPDRFIWGDMAQSFFFENINKKKGVDNLDGPGNTNPGQLAIKHFSKKFPCKKTK